LRKLQKQEQQQREHLNLSKDKASLDDLDLYQESWLIVIQKMLPLLSFILSRVTLLLDHAKVVVNQNIKQLCLFVERSLTQRKMIMQS
jgi:hypothetical protein